MLIVLIMAIASMAHAATLQTNPDSKTTGSVSKWTHKYYEFNKLAGWKHTVCLKTTNDGDADLYGHWTPNVSTGTWQFRSWNATSQNAYDCISFEASQSGTYYLAVFGYEASEYEIYVVRNPMDVPWQLKDELSCPMDNNYPAQCGTLTTTQYGPFGSTWGNSRQNPFFNGADDSFHVGVDWKADEDDPIYAVSDGKVKRSGDYGANWGHFVVIEHSVNGFNFTAVYGHLKKESLPDDGDIVYAGDEIGNIIHLNKLGEVDHLHFNMYPGLYRYGGATGSLPFNTFPQDYINAGNQSLYQ